MLNKQFFKKNLVIIIAIVVGLIAASIYYFSGQSSLQENTRELSVQESISTVEVKEGSSGQKTVQIKCKDGSDYEVYYPPGSTDYSSISSSKCLE
jgi:cell division protein YceG involved in septum cleavage